MGRSDKRLPGCPPARSIAVTFERKTAIGWNTLVSKGLFVEKGANPWYKIREQPDVGPTLCKR